MRVLVVDDTADVADSLAALLEHTEPTWQIRKEYGGAQGLSAALESPPDAVILDVVMPDLTGIHLAQHLRERLGQRVAIVAFTRCPPGEITAVERALFDGIVLKPAEVEELIGAIKTAVGWSGRSAASRSR